MRKDVILCLLLAWVAIPLMAQERMDNAKMATIFDQEADLVEGEPGAWQVMYQDRILLVLTDEDNNRMRIFTPILEEKAIDAKEMQKMLTANFHSALDAKYSLYNGYVISVFTHPLGELSRLQLVDAMQQVVNLAETFGTTYSSTELIFGGGEAEEEEKKINQSPSKQKRS